ncbi:hypothetical protein T439DRAFT_347347 [Meredithblackwellia eburnea MCA 4105]
MVKTLTLAAAFLSLASSSLALLINTPVSLIACEPTSLSWSGGTAPYYLSVIPGGDPSGSILENLGTQTGTSYTWNVDLAPGTNITISLKDSTGTTVYTAAVVIQSGSSTSCVGSSSTSKATSSGAAVTTGTATAKTVGSSAASQSAAAASASASTAHSGSSTLRVSGAMGVLALIASIAL